MFYVNSPLEQFEVFELLGIHTFLGYTFALTNLGLYTVIVATCVFFMHYAGMWTLSNTVPLVPSRSAIGIETFITSINTMVKDQIGSSKEIYTPFIYGMFLLLLLGNLFSNVPYNYSIAGSAIFSLGLSVSLWIGNTLLASHKHGFHFFSFFLPAGTPTILVPLLFLIEMVSYASRALSLGIRSLANLIAGHALLAILSGIIYKIMCVGTLAFLASSLPLAVFICLVLLEILVSFIQAFVWCTLFSGYLRDAEYLH